MERAEPREEWVDEMNCSDRTPLAQIVKYVSKEAQYPFHNGHVFDLTYEITSGFLYTVT